MSNISDRFSNTIMVRDYNHFLSEDTELTESIKIYEKTVNPFDVDNEPIVECYARVFRIGVWNKKTDDKGNINDKRIVVILSKNNIGDITIEKDGCVLLSNNENFAITNVRELMGGIIEINAGVISKRDILVKGKDRYVR